MNIGSIAGPLTKAMEGMEPKELSKVLKGLQGENKTMGDIKKVCDSLAGMLGGVGSMGAELSTLMKKMEKSAAMTPKSPADPKMTKNIKKLLDDFNKTRQAALEAEIAKVEAELKSLKALLAQSKKASGSGWMM